MKARIMLSVLFISAIFCRSVELYSQNELKKSITIPFILDHNRMLIEAEFRGKDAKWHKGLLWVDTGNPNFFISERFAYELGIEINDTTTGQEFTSPENVMIAGMKIDYSGVRSTVDLVDKWLFNTMHNDGNLPSSVLSKYNVIFDYPARKLTISETPLTKHRGISSPAIINRANGIIQMDATIDGENYSFALDNGASFSYVPDFLLEKLRNRHPGWPNSIGAVGCANIWGWWPDEANWPMLRIPEIKWGTINFSDVIITGLPAIFRNKTDVGTNYSRKTALPVNGFLGPNIFKEYCIEIDYRNSILYFEKVREKENEMDIAGLTIKPLNNGMYTIIGIMKKGNEKTCIQPDDTIIQIGSMETTGATMGRVVDALRGKPGDKRTLIIKRGNNQVSAEISVQHIL
jgi:hypothetical protein